MHCEQRSRPRKRYTDDAAKPLADRWFHYGSPSSPVMYRQWIHSGLGCRFPHHHSLRQIAYQQAEMALLMGSQLTLKCHPDIILPLLTYVPLATAAQASLESEHRLANAQKNLQIKEMLIESLNETLEAGRAVRPGPMCLKCEVLACVPLSLVIVTASQARRQNRFLLQLLSAW